MIATAERLVGNPIAGSPAFGDDGLLDRGATSSTGDLLVDIEPDYPTLDKKPPVRTASNNSDSSMGMTRSPLRERMAAVLHKSLGDREIAIDIEGGLETKRYYSVTDEGGRFNANYPLNFQPTRVVVSSSETSSSIEPIVIQPHGVTVISDIDDTIRHTGVTGGKREVLQNVLVKAFEDVRLDGISEWYQHMEERGAVFHYVSNSPWQLYQPILEFLAYEKFPVGTLHLKQYQGILNGLMEPVVTRKKNTLERIVKDFPSRQFILIGDSGEADLEAYVRLALEFPEQILAIYIRDITLPADADLSEVFPKAAVEEEQDLIDLSERKSPPPIPPKPAHLIRRKPVPNSNAIFDEAKCYSEQEHARSSGVGEAIMGLGVRNAAKAAAASAIDCASRKLYADNDKPPPLPPRVRQNASAASPMVISSSQDYLDYDPDKMDSVEKRIYMWKRRLQAARKALPSHTQIRLFRTAADVEAESLNLIKKERLL